MCASHDDWIDVPPEQRSMAASWRNVAQPGSLSWKAERWAANMFRRVRHLAVCQHLDTLFGQGSPAGPATPGPLNFMGRTAQLDLWP